MERKVLSSSELSKYMKENEKLFCGRSYAAASISTMATTGKIPARQMCVKGGVIKKIINERYSFDISEIQQWCVLGADRAACIEVLKSRNL